MVIKTSFFRNLFLRKPEERTEVQEESPKVRVLVVERDDEERIAIKRLLQNAFEIIDFANDFDATVYIKNNPIDIALVNDSLVENINMLRRKLNGSL